MRIAYLTVPAMITLLFLGGCSSQDGPTEVGQTVLLDSEPSNTQDVAEYKGILAAGSGLGGDATIVGRVRSGGIEPWDTTQATFLLASANIEHDHEANAHSDCKFCQAKELESMVLVRVVDESGSIINTDPRSLLGLKENQVVIAQAQGTMDGEALLFDASRIFIRDQ